MRYFIVGRGNNIVSHQWIGNVHNSLQEDIELLKLVELSFKKILLIS